VPGAGLQFGIPPFAPFAPFVGLGSKQWCRATTTPVNNLEHSKGTLSEGVTATVKVTGFYYLVKNRAALSAC
jgi:hypothetical protein